MSPNYPSLYQINTRGMAYWSFITAGLRHAPWMTYLILSLIGSVREMGFDWIWLLSVWYDR